MFKVDMDILCWVGVKKKRTLVRNVETEKDHADETGRPYVKPQNNYSNNELNGCDPGGTVVTASHVKAIHLKFVHTLVMIRNTKIEHFSSDHLITFNQ